MAAKLWSLFYYYLNMIYIGCLEFWHLLDQLVPLWPFHGCPSPSLRCGFIIATQMVILFAAYMANSMVALVVRIDSNKYVGEPCVCHLARYIPGNKSFALTHLGPHPRRLFYALQFEPFAKLAGVCSSLLVWLPCQRWISDLLGRFQEHCYGIAKHVSYHFIYICHSLGLTKTDLY